MSEEYDVTYMPWAGTLTAWTVPTPVVLACFFESSKLKEVEEFKQEVKMPHCERIKRIFNNQMMIINKHTERIDIYYKVNVEHIINFAPYLVNNTPGMSFHNVDNETIIRVINDNEKLSAVLRHTQDDSIIYRDEPINLEDFIGDHTKHFDEIIKYMKRAADSYIEGLMNLQIEKGKQKILSAK